MTLVYTKNIGVGVCGGWGSGGGGSWRYVENFQTGCNT